MDTGCVHSLTLLDNNRLLRFTSIVGVLLLLFLLLSLLSLLLLQSTRFSLVPACCRRREQAAGAQLWRPDLQQSHDICAPG